MPCRSIALLLTILLSACRSTDHELEKLYQAARQDVWHGALGQALQRIALGEAKAGDSLSEWRFRFRLLHAEVFLLRLDAPSALTLLNNRPPNEPRFGSINTRRTYLLAQAQIAQRKLAEAFVTLAEAKRQAAASSDDETLLDIDALHGQALLRASKWLEGESLLLTVLDRASSRKDAYHQALALQNLGSGRQARNRFDEAVGFFERVLALNEIEPYTIYAAALINAGISYSRLGQFESAVAVQRRAIESREKSGEPLYLQLALGELGNTYVLQGDARRGLSYLSRAFAVATGANLMRDAAVWAGNVATAAVELGDLDQADRFNREGIRLKLATKGSTLYNTLNTAIIATGRGKLDEARGAYEEALRASTTDPAAQWDAHAGLARVALAAGDGGTATRHFEVAMGLIQRTRSDLLRPEYRLTFLTRVIRFYQQYVDTLVAAGKTDRALLVADGSRAVVLAERMGGSAQAQAPTTTASFVAAAKRSRSVWLTYWLAPKQSYVWVVNASGVHRVTLPGGAQIEQLVQQYRSMVETSSADPLAQSGTPGDALYAMVVAPVAQFIPPGSSVRIVPDGALHNVNFETLPVDGPRRHYWIEDVTVAIAPSLGLLASNAGRAHTSDPASLLLVGDPTPRVKEFPRLGYAPVEMQAVSKHFSAAHTVRHDSDRATPAQFLAAEPDRFSVIHFTAHAAANRTSPLESAVILAGPAGADRLYARDVAERSLKAELVTISACRSAGERAYAGEGLIGFSWAFLRAGARQVIAGLWDVDDQSTATLMDALYAGIARGSAAPDALRAAKLALMRQGGNVARPYYWGPFELFTVSP